MFSPGDPFRDDDEPGLLSVTTAEPDAGAHIAQEEVIASRKHVPADQAPPSSFEDDDRQGSSADQTARPFLRDTDAAVRTLRISKTPEQVEQATMIANQLKLAASIKRNHPLPGTLASTFCWGCSTYGLFI